MDSGAKVKWVVLGVPILIVATCGIGVGVGTITSKNARNNEHSLAVKAGLPASYEELRRPIDPETDAGAALEKFGTLLSAAERTSEGQAWKQAKGTSARIVAARAFFRKQPEVIQARNAVFTKTTLTQMSKPEDGFNILFPRYAEAKNVMKLSSDEALLLAADGRVTEAFDLLHRCARFISVAHQDRILIGELVAIANTAIISRAAGKILAANSRNPVALEAFSRFHSVARCPADMRVALRGEYGMLLAVEEQIRTGKASVLDVLAFGGEDREGAADTAMRLYFSTPGMLDRQMANVYKNHRILYASIPEDSQQFVARSNAVQVHEQFITGQRGWDTVLSEIFSPVFLGAVESEAKAEAEWRALKAGLAAIEYRNRTGQFPAKLPVSGPLSLDPFTEKPLIYKRTRDGFIVYSVGTDKKDDGGVLYKTGSSTGLDNGFGVPYNVQ